MWPKLLDLTQDECRGALRRLELESYSNVVGAFRAQGTLNADKLRILKDLREAFHISEARHKAEVRRVVNDESLSTIAKMIYGPNSEIEWNKEGSRGFLIINRKPSQTALSVIADKAGEFVGSLNKNLKQPSKTKRERPLNLDNGANVSEKIVTNDPKQHQSNVKVKAEKQNVIHTTSVNTNRPENIAPKKRIDSNKSEIKRDSHKPDVSTEAIETSPVKISTTTSFENKLTLSPIIENAEMNKPKQITGNIHRRKSTTVLANHNTPPKAIMLSNRRDTMIENTSKIREIQSFVQQQQKQFKSHANEARLIPKEKPEICEEITLNPPSLPIIAQHRTISSDKDIRVIETIKLPQKMDTIKGKQNVMNAISQGAQWVKVIDSKIIKKPISIPSMYVSKPAQVIPRIPVTVKPTFTPINPTNVEYLTTNDCSRLTTKPVKTHMVQVAAPDTASIINPTTSKNSISNHQNNIISIPTARNPNIVKTSNKTIMHVSPNLSQGNPIKNRIISNTIQNHTKYQSPKQIIQIIPSQAQHRTVIIHPNSTITKVPSQVQTVNDVTPEFMYKVNDWQNYDPRHINNQNGYAKIVCQSPNNGQDYQNHANNIISENINYDEDFITEEYITSEEFSTDNVIEEVDVTLVRNNIIELS